MSPAARGDVQPATIPRAVFADTFYFLALVMERDEAHSRAVGASRDPRASFVTTTCVLIEVADALAKTAGRSCFAGILDSVREDPDVVVVEATRELFDRGVALYLGRPDKRWSLTDCISFVVMRDMGITEALTADRHFEQAGFTALLK